jgi:hypothetical protein
LTTGGPDDRFQPYGLGRSHLSAEGGDPVVPASGFVPRCTARRVEGLNQTVGCEPGKHAIERTYFEPNACRLPLNRLGEAVGMPRAFGQAQQNLKIV